MTDTKPYRVEILPENLAVVVHYHDSFSMTMDLPFLNEELIQVFNNLTEKHYMILNWNPNIKVAIQEVIVAASMVARGDNASLKHPNVIETIAISEDKMIQLASKGINSEMFDFTKTYICETWDEAMAYIEEKQRDEVLRQ